LAVLRPWTDAGNSATLAVSQIETLLGAQQLGKISKPGTFFDFTKYRPVTRYRMGTRELIVPNTIVTYARQSKGGPDLVFLNMLEPTMFAEKYISSVVELLKVVGAERYSLLGSMYDMVPHSRPLIVTGGGVGEKASAELKKAGLTSSPYEGPTTICALIAQDALRLGMETLSVMVRLPQYTQLEKDYTGQVRLLEVLNSLYGIPVEEAAVRRAEQQIKDIDIEVSRNRKTKDIVAHLEAYYDAQSATKQKKEETRLSPDIENFLKDMENRFKQE
jgi:predicted ATP-grasp superfamily ATP-dependent carboligase